MSLAKDTLKAGDGIYRMVPCFIPVKFGIPGRRLKISQDDYFKYGDRWGTGEESGPTVSGTELCQGGRWF